ncbi:hypothetical protein TWF481_007548 [Arthrobotrys musiformis]|uniref:Uncharacterized protein n=1 Tax=Arthrobotrys musiformis TaxID=47236 RepID=A0AAV9WBZ4_9PEZI
MINSFSCRWTNRTEAFDSCTVKIDNGAEKGRNRIFGALDGTGYSEQIETFTKGDMEVTRDDVPYGQPKIGITRCIDVNDGLRVRYWDINGCTCEFFDKPSCEGTRIYQQGSPGRDVGGIENEEVLPARSFRCWLPYGVTWGEERRDSIRVLGRTTRNLIEEVLPTTVITPNEPQALRLDISTSISNPPIATWIPGATSRGAGGIASDLGLVDANPTSTLAHQTNSPPTKTIPTTLATEISNIPTGNFSAPPDAEAFIIPAEPPAAPTEVPIVLSNSEAPAGPTESLDAPSPTDPPVPTAPAALGFALADAAHIPSGVTSTPIQDPAVASVTPVI